MKYNKLSVWALACSVGLIAGIFIPVPHNFYLILVSIGIILGVISLIQIGKSKEKGRWLAILAIAIPILYVIAGLLILGSAIS